MPCSDCSHWLIARVTDYENGERVFNVKSPDGFGQCLELKIETAAEFGCAKHEPGSEHVEVMAKKGGSPWHHKRWGGCPDCGGQAPNADGTYKEGAGVVGPPGDVSCERCQRTGRVMYWDDGYVGEEKTRLHPNEKAAGPPPPPQCPVCDAVVERAWKACPFCGNKLTSDEVKKVSDLSFLGEAK